MSILNFNKINSTKQRFLIEGTVLRYPTEEKIPVLFKTNVDVVSGQHLLKMSMYVVKMEDDYLLRVHFLSKTNFDKLLESALGVPLQPRHQIQIVCSRIEGLRSKSLKF